MRVKVRVRVMGRMRVRVRVRVISSPYTIIHERTCMTQLKRQMLFLFARTLTFPVRTYPDFFSALHFSQASQERNKIVEKLCDDVREMVRLLPPHTEIDKSTYAYVDMDTDDEDGVNGGDGGNGSSDEEEGFSLKELDFDSDISGDSDRGSDRSSDRGSDNDDNNAQCS